MVLFQINEDALPLVEAFTYLGRKISYNNINWSAVYHSLSKARRREGMIVREFLKTVSKVQACGIMYKEVAQSVILYGSGSWVVTGEMLKVLEGFQHRAARWIIGMTATHC